MLVLGIGAHPDDLEINCGGILARYKETGHQVIMAHVCSGDKGHFSILPSELAKIRRQEAKTAAELIGAESFWLGFNDGEIIAENLENRSKMVDFIRKIKPDIIFTHTSSDYHADHMAVGRLVTDAVFMCTVPHIQTQYPAIPKEPQIYFFEPYGGLQFNPDTYVDISGVMEMKNRMMAAHNSQVIWLKEHDNTDVLAYIQTLAAFRGIQCGKQYAEGFVRYQASLRGLTERLLP